MLYRDLKHEAVAEDQGCERRRREAFQLGGPGPRSPGIF